MSYFSIKETNLKYKKLTYERDLSESWEEFLGEDYTVKAGQYISSSLKNVIGKIEEDEEDALIGGNGIIYIEYTKISTGETLVLLENEWLIMSDSKKIHATDYIKRNLYVYYDKELNYIEEGNEIDNELEEVETESIEQDIREEEIEQPKEIAYELPKVVNKIPRTAFIDAYNKYLVRINANSLLGNYAVPIEKQDIIKSYKDMGCFFASIFTQVGKEEVVVLDNSLKQEKNKVGYYILDSSFSV